MNARVTKSRRLGIAGARSHFKAIFDRRRPGLLADDVFLHLDQDDHPR